MDPHNREEASLSETPSIVHQNGASSIVPEDGEVLQNGAPRGIAELETQSVSERLESLANNGGGEMDVDRLSTMPGSREAPLESKASEEDIGETTSLASRQSVSDSDRQSVKPIQKIIKRKKKSLKQPSEDEAAHAQVDQIVTELQTELHELAQPDLITADVDIDQPDQKLVEVQLDRESVPIVKATDFVDLDLTGSAGEDEHQSKSRETQSQVESGHAPVEASNVDNSIETAHKMESELLPIALKDSESWTDVSQAVPHEERVPQDSTALQAPADTPGPAGPTESRQPAALEEAVDIGPIPFFFIINSTGRRAASPRLSNDTIDFGSPGARITSDKFVGVRYVREGGEASQSGSASPGARLLGAIQDLPAKTKAAAEKTVSSMLAVLPSPRKGNAETVKTPNGFGQPSRRSSNMQDSEAPSTSLRGGQGQPSAPNFTKRRSSTDSPELHVWEIIYKDHSKHTQDRPWGPLQQIQFETTKAGFHFIQRIIDVWSMEATDSSAMTEAAHALLKAQDALHEGQHDYPFSKPEPSDTFPRTLFGKARGNGKAESALPRTVSEDLRSETSAVERTESGVSAAESVESMSSVRSSASGGHVAIALVASGNKNKYEGGLQHVVIPETEATPPPEKPGAPLVEGRFLPNMIPRSHIMQQPHIRALAAALPVRFRLSPWILLYSTWRDGISLQTMYRKASKKGPSILVILDQKHNVFGCYTSENWKVHPRYYGGGESFVFQLYPEMRVYRWTRENNYFMFGTPDSIHIGGGSHFALSLSGDLLHGATGSCETFGNGSLVQPDEYEILHVELWGFQ